MKGYLISHKKRYHGPEKDTLFELLKCPSCEFETKSSQYLRMHVDSKHNKETLYRCSLCEYKNFRKQNVEYHQKTKHPEDQCKVIGDNCQECQNNIDHKSCRLPKSDIKLSKIYVKLKTANNLMCEECNFTTNFKRHLRNHNIYNHSRERDENQSAVFNCDKCDLQTNSEQYLVTHKESTHNRIVRFKCDQCEYVAYRKQSVDTHQKTYHKKSK